MKKSLLLLSAALTALSMTAAPVVDNYALSQRRSATSEKRISLAEVNARKLPSRQQGPRQLRKHPGVNGSRVAAGFRQASQRGFAPLRYKAPAFAEALDANLYGLKVYQDDWTDSNYAPGLYTVPVNSPEGGSMIFTSEDVSTGSFYDGQNVYVVYLETIWGYVLSAKFNIIDATTGKLLDSKELPATTPEVYAATYVPSLDAALAFGIADNTLVLMKVALDGSMTIIREVPDTNFGGGLTTAQDGTVYGLSLTGALYTINPVSGAYTLVGNTGVRNDYISSIAYDDKNKVIFHSNITTNDDESEAYSSFFSINPTTAAATKRYDLPVAQEYGSLFFLAEAAPGAPAEPTELLVDFPNGGLSGTVSFVPPTKLANGNPGSGAISYTVTFNGTVKASGSTSFGADKVNVPVSVDEAGTYTVRVVCSNAAGESRPVRVMQYLGADQLNGVASVAVARNGNKYTIGWPAPTTVNGGYLNKDEVVYTVTRYVDGTATVLTSTLKGTTVYTDTYTPADDSLRSLYYTVKASFLGNESPEVASARTVLGSAVPPYGETFADEEAASYYSVIDNNHDGSTWSFSADDRAMYFVYDERNDGDDYLVLPPMKLEAGKAYEVSFLAGRRSHNYPETIAVYAGTEPTVAGLSTEVIAKTNVVATYGYDPDTDVAVGDTFSGYFVPATSGVYYFALHATSPANGFGILVTNVGVSAPSASTVPAAVSDLTLTSASNGDPTVSISFTAPSLDIAGKPLASLTKVDVYRGDELVKTVNPAIGAKNVVVEDTQAGEGNVTYTVVPSNEDGEGVPASASVYVGISEPVAPASLSYAYGADFGEVVLSWPAVTVDSNGHTLPDVHYILCKPNASGDAWEVIDKNITATTYTVRACAGDAEQNLISYAVFAANDRGESAQGASALVPVGASYSMPFSESGELDTVVGINNGGGEWGRGDDQYFEGVSSSDGDNAFFIYRAQAANVTGSIFTGRIHIDEDSNAPVFTFSYFCQDSNDQNMLQPVVNLGDGFVPVGEAVITGTGVPGTWCEASVSLKEYKGKDIMVGLRLQVVNMSYTLIDNFSVTDQKRFDLSAEIGTPQTVGVGETLPIAVRVKNIGSEAMAAYTVDYFVNGKAVGSVDGTNLASGTSIIRTFNYEVKAGTPELIHVYAVVNAEGDENLKNNTTLTAEVTVTYPDLPAPSDITYATSDEGVTLSWSKPEGADGLASVTETFESYDSFAIGLAGDWKFVDRDNAPVGGFQGIDIPNVPTEQPASFFVFDNSVGNFNSTYATVSGTKFLAALYNSDGSKNDDWAISPELCGSAQTISFYARAYSAEYPETIEVLYSTTDTNPDNFISVRTFPGISVDNTLSFTRFEFDVPEGAKYFALRFRSQDTFMVMIDNVTYVPANATALSLQGYNVYRNGEKINDTLVTGTSYLETGEYPDAAYTVTAVYSTGESRPSMPCYPFGNAVEGIAAGVSVTGTYGAIMVAGTDDAVAVYDMAGRTIYAGAAGRIAAAPGLYIVRIARSTWKVLVK